MTGNSLAAVDDGQDRREILEQVVVEGDLSKLSVSERLDYYRMVCESVGLNPFTKPFDYVNLNGKLTLYARKDCADQLRRRDGISVKIIAREMVEGVGVYAVTAQATTVTGRSDESIGAVHLSGLKGEAAANAVMKAETKAKRRVTLSICGLGMLDESEIDGIPDARPVEHPAAESDQLATEEDKAELSRRLNALHGYQREWLYNDALIPGSDPPRYRLCNIAKGRMLASEAAAWDAMLAAAENRPDETS